MIDEPGDPKRRPHLVIQSLVADAGKGLLQDFFRFVIAGCIGVLLGAVVCIYLGLPIILSLVGGVVVLGVAIALIFGS